jgi:ferric-dicitrate binding protein FerR (iron transport regulator)
VNPKEFISWKDGIYFFNKESLEEMMKTVGRNYDVEVFFNGEALKKLRFSGQLKKYERVEEFLQFIETGGDVTFIVKDRTITVNPK